jgi:hypothetical protein
MTDKIDPIIPKMSTPPFLLGDRLFGRVLTTLRGDAQELVIVIRPDTGIKDIERAWKEIETRRDELHNGEGARYVLLKRYATINGPKKIVEAMTRDYILSLCIAAEEAQDNHRPAVTLGVLDAINLLKLVGLEDDAVKEFIPAGLNDVLKGRRPDSPFDIQMVKSKLLRTGRKALKGYNLANIPDLTASEDLLFKNGYFERGKIRQAGLK